jgi:hypothetical protein
MSHLDNCLRDIEEERLSVRHRQLVPPENGERALAERKPGEPWVDMTRERIVQLESAIAEFELIADELRNREAL